MDAYLRSCGICDEPFLACREGGFNQQYCDGECSAVARVESAGGAQDRHRRKTRRTPWGREQHKLEQRKYREKKRRERGARVGDQLSRPIETASMVAGMTQEPPEPLSATASAEPAPELPATAGPAVPVEAQPEPLLLSWRVITVPQLAALAREWLGSARVVRCACCNRPGRVTCVVEKNESPWTVARRAQLRQRRGLG